MKIYSTYSVKIKHYNSIFKNTISVYRHAVDYLITVCLNEWKILSLIDGSLLRQQFVERLCHSTKDNPSPRYPDFDMKFYKMPSYMRRGAINEAIGKVSYYMGNLSNWMKNPVGNRPSYPKAGFIYPAMYRTVMYDQTGKYTAKIKVYIRNTWDWINIDLKKSDMDYIYRRCNERKPNMTLPLSEQLENALSLIEGTYKASEVEVSFDEGESVNKLIPATPDVRNYTYTVVKGEIYYRQDSVMFPVKIRGDKNRVLKLIELRDSVLDCIKAQQTH